MTLRPEIFEDFDWLVAGMSTRQGGVSGEQLGMNLGLRVGDDPQNVLENRRRFFGGLGIPLEQLAIPGQVHGDRIHVVSAAGSYPDTDALITNAARVYLCVTVADCVPILLVDPVTRTVAAVHAGWRGTAAHIVGEAVGKMGKEFDVHPGDVLAYIGPSAGSCCYEVGEEVVEKFSPLFLQRKGEKALLDLKSANKAQLEKAGVSSTKIELSPFCSITETALFHSHRRDGARSGRMMAVMGLR
jgi:polyphenol oxidase